MQTNSNSGTLKNNRQKKQKYDNCKFSTLKCGSLNVCGIRQKLLYLEFCNLIQELVQEPKETRKGSLSFKRRVWQPCASKYTFMLL